MPFGVDLKSIIIGIILALFVYPFVMSKFYASRSASTTNGG